jgi:hypothetical protein
LKNLRSGGVNRDRTVSVQCVRYRPQSGPVMGGSDRLVGDPELPSADEIRRFRGGWGYR